MPVINIKVRGKVAFSPTEMIVCGNSDYVVNFDFDDEWKSHVRKTARFTFDRKYVDVIFEGDTCNAPVICRPTTVEVGIYAGDLRSTTPASIRCIKGILSDKGIPAVPPSTPEWVKVILNSRAEHFYIGEDNHIYVRKVDGTIEDIGDLSSATGVTPAQVVAMIETALLPINSVIPSTATSDNKLVDKESVDSIALTKQDKLVSGQNVKTINGQSVLGNGDIVIQTTVPVEDVKVDGVSVVTDKIANIDLSGKVDKTDGKGLSTNDFTNEDKTKLDSLENYDDTEITERINNIESVIPNQATEDNQLADKDFVNSSIGTNTAYFKGTYNSVQELQQVTATNNDYAIVIVEPQSGATRYDRYKYNSETRQWVFEFSINNSSFTTEQWAAIQSGITETLVSEFNGHIDNESIHVTESEKAKIQEIDDKANLEDVYTKVQSDNLLNDKVDKVEGKGLSENDYTNAEKTKLDSLENYDDTEVREEISNKQDKLTAGTNITIEGNVISATGGGSEINYVTPQQFGAKGDGEADDTSAIQSALNYAFSNKMSVYFKGGTYKITNKLIIPDETKIFGDGRKSIIKSTISDGYVLQGTNVNDDTSIRHCSFDSICFENGNIADAETHLIQGDFVGKIYGGYFNNCTISKYYNVFEHISNCTYLMNCRFTTIYNCFMNTSVDSVIDGCYINASTYSSAYGSKAFGHSFNSTSLTNSIIDYFSDVFAVSSINSGTIEGNTFNRCETIFHDTFQRLAVSNNIFSVVDYVIKFDNLVQSDTNHLMSNIVFSNNVGIDVDYYFYVANGVNVIPAKCEFRGNRISVSSNGTMSNVDVGFRSTSTTETAYNSMKDVYFDFWDLKTFENGLPSADLRGDTAKSVVSFPFMRAIYENKLFINIDGRWFSGGGGAVDDVKVDGVSVVADKVANIDLSNKVDKVDGKGLSTNDYTNEEKSKLASLHNYDDTELQAQINALDTAVLSKENTSNKITTISDVSTNEQYPSAKAVYDLFNSIVNGNEVAY